MLYKKKLLLFLSLMIIVLILHSGEVFSSSTFKSIQPTNTETGSSPTEQNPSSPQPTGSTGPSNCGQLHLFRDGKKEPAYQFYNQQAYVSNPGGWVACTASVDSTSTVYPGGEVEDYARVVNEAIVAHTGSVRNNAVVDNSLIYGIVSGNATVQNNSKLSDPNTKVYGSALVDNSNLSDNSTIYGKAQVFESFLNGFSEIFGEANVHHTFLQSRTGPSQQIHPMIYDDAVVNDSQVDDYAKVYEDASLTQATVGDVAEIYGNAKVKYQCLVVDNAKIYGSAELQFTQVSGTAQVYGNAVVNSSFITDGASLFENALFENSVAFGFAKVHGHSDVTQCSSISGEADVQGYPRIAGPIITGKCHD